MLNNGVAFIRTHPKLAVVGGVGVVGAVLVMHRKSTQVDSQSMDGSAPGTADVGNVLGGSQPGTIAGVDYRTVTKTVTKPAPLPKSGFLDVILKNKEGKPYRASLKALKDPSRSCPQGFALVSSSGGVPECISLDQRLTGGRTAPIVRSKTAKAATTGAAGEGETPMRSMQDSSVPLGFVSPWTVKHAMNLPMYHEWEAAQDA